MKTVCCCCTEKKKHTTLANVQDYAKSPRASGQFPIVEHCAALSNFVQKYVYLYSQICLFDMKVGIQCYFNGAREIIIVCVTLMRNFPIRMAYESYYSMFFFLI